MNGEQLLQKLQALTPEQRQLEVVVEGEDSWLYGASGLRICLEHEGRDVDDDEEDDHDKGTPAIVITSNY